MSAPATELTGFVGVLGGGVLRGLTLECSSPLTFLVDADVEEPLVRPSSYALRLLAGIGRPSAGRVRVFGRDPWADFSLRREIALLGDDVLLDRSLPLQDAAVEIARARGLSGFSRTEVAAMIAGAPPDDARRVVADRVAAPERARLVLVNRPERYVRDVDRDALTAIIRSAIERGARVVVATAQLDAWLHLASDTRASGGILVGGTVVAAGLAHGLPWALPADGVSTRVVRVIVDDDADAAASTASAASRLAADLFADAEVAPFLAAVEPIGRTELRLHTREPRALSRALAGRAHRGLPIRQMVVFGATAAALAQASMMTRGK